MRGNHILYEAVVKNKDEMDRPEMQWWSCCGVSPETSSRHPRVSEGPSAEDGFAFAGDEHGLDHVGEHRS